MERERNRERDGEIWVEKRERGKDIDREVRVREIEEIK